MGTKVTENFRHFEIQSASLIWRLLTANVRGEGRGRKEEKSEGGGEGERALISRNQGEREAMREGRGRKERSEEHTSELQSR